MKLKNKKTGEIVERSSIVTLKYKISSCSSSLVEAEEYSSIRQLNEDWEDYKPTMPLIKDPKIRKAVRAWAEVDGIDVVEIVSKYQLLSLDEQCAIEFFTEIYPEYKHNEEHTIAELCGEEKE